MYTLWFIPDSTYLLFTCIAGVNGGKDGGVENHLEMGKKLLAAGQLADALSHFHAAVGEYWIFLHDNLNEILCVMMKCCIVFHRMQL